MTVRCKFTCTSKREYKHWDRTKPNLYEYLFTAVASGSEENQKFFAWTPSGEVRVSTVRDGSFEVGQDYYLDLTLAEQLAAATT